MILFMFIIDYSISVLIFWSNKHPIECMASMAGTAFSYPPEVSCIKGGI